METMIVPGGKVDDHLEKFAVFVHFEGVVDEVGILLATGA